MSEATYRQVIEAWNARDIDGCLALCHPDVEFRSLISGVDGLYRGHDGLRRYFADLAETLGDTSLELEEVEERGDWVIATGLNRGTGAASRIPLEWPVSQAVRFQDGLCVFAVSARDREAALAAAGLT